MTRLSTFASAAALAAFAAHAAPFPPVLPLAALACSAGTRADGPTGTDTAPAGDKLGTSAVAVGDFDGDGVADTAFGAPADASGRPGVVWLVWGRAGGLPCPLALPGPGVLRIDGAVADDRFGWSLAAGDLDGDGVADLVVGAPGESAAYVFHGRRGVRPVGLTAAQAARLAGLPVDGTGQSVAMGDFDGDGLGDVAVGNANAAIAVASACVVYGRAGGVPSRDLNALAAADGYRLTGLASNNIAVAAAGDANGDGVADLLVGAPDAARAALVFGRGTRGAASVAMGDPALASQITGRAGSWFGFAVAGIGDLNGDGRADLAIGAPLEAPAPALSQAGRAYVVFGRPAFPATLDAATQPASSGFMLSGAVSADKAGWSVAGAGDVNGDGRSDLLVGAPYSGYTARAAGAAYVVYGHAGTFANITLAGGLDGTNGFQISGVAAGDLAGFAVARAGDVNGDGGEDLVVGGRNALLSRGSAWVLHGQPADRVPPVVTVTGVVAGKTYATTPAPGCSATDAGSGVAVPPVLQVVAGTPTRTVTPYAATCPGAQDRAGNLAAPVSVAYKVRRR